MSQGQATHLATISSFNPMYVYFSVPEFTYLEYRRRNPGPDSRRAGRIPLALVADGRLFAHKGFINLPIALWIRPQALFL